ncbi:hypothetical protein TEA_015514 [Camellia sinensis var. sinensis]|uniref:Ribosomal protein eL8/eL30/eS12/Gadd45 domain-containing protein n=1 Tax=Camellia sinensis var. sinensis TaxID=542762 RepID=A0A4S4DZW6_CAMSN|nr:hypothetical protein TEA_015514 [Camellia sinensis var. sinensis]
MGSDSEAEKSAQKEKKKISALAPIAKPLAGKKLSRRTFKLVRRGIITHTHTHTHTHTSHTLSLSLSLSLYIYIYLHIQDLYIYILVIVSAAEHKCLKRGVKEVVKTIRRGNKGFCVIAGNISPIDVITHLPILCEEADIPYIYVSSKEDLANAGATKRPTCCVLVLTKPMKGELGQEQQEKLKADYDQVVSDVSELTSSMF